MESEMGHFDYLLDEQDRDFFAKAASVPEEPTSPELEKQASLFRFESTLDRDIEILRDCGPRGSNLGMVKRASDYIDRRVAEGGMDEDEFALVFDKVASEAILEDLSAAREEILKTASADLNEVLLTRAFFLLAGDMAKHAELEKQAFMPMVRALGAAGKAGAGALAKKGLGAVKNAPTAMRASRIGRAERGIAKLRESAKSPMAMKGTAGGDAYKASLEKSIGKKEKRLDKLMQNPKYQKAQNQRLQQAGRAEAGGTQAMPTQAPAAASSTKLEAAQATKKRDATAGAAKAEEGAQEAAKTKQMWSQGGDAAKTTQMSADDIAKIEAQAATNPTLSSAYTKFREQGWSALTPGEKSRLMEAGAAGAVAYDAVSDG